MLMCMPELRESARVLVLQLHEARKKARAAAVAEVAALLEDVGCRPLRGGPLSDVSGIAWVAVNTTHVSELMERIAPLGYSSSVWLAVPGSEAGSDRNWSRARWKGTEYVLQPIYSESIAELQREAPDRRPFLLECGDGVVRRIVGYRGGRGPMEHRALPVLDARLLVNILGRPAGGLMLDPFAGAGSILLYGRRAGWRTVSVDIDRTLRYGLLEIAGNHVVGDAAQLPFRSSSLDAIATEPPYHPSAISIVIGAVEEASRVLRPRGRMSMLVSADQASVVRTAAQRSGFTIDIDIDVSRKGTAVTCLRMVLRCY